MIGRAPYQRENSSTLRDIDGRRNTKTPWASRGPITCGTGPGFILIVKGRRHHPSCRKYVQYRNEHGAGGWGVVPYACVTSNR